MGTVFCGLLSVPLVQNKTIGTLKEPQNTVPVVYIKRTL